NQPVWKQSVSGNDMERFRHYFGGHLRSFRADEGLRLSEVDYTSKKCSPHTHAWPFFALLLRGHYLENFRDRQLTYRAFDLGFHPETTGQAEQRGGGARFFLVERGEGGLRGVPKSAPPAPRDPRMCAPRDAWVAPRLYHEHRSSGTHWPLLTEALVLE